MSGEDINHSGREHHHGEAEDPSSHLQLLVQTKDKSFRNIKNWDVFGGFGSSNRRGGG